MIIILIVHFIVTKNAIHVRDYVRLTHVHVAIAIWNGIDVAVVVGLMAAAECWNIRLESLAQRIGGIRKESYQKNKFILRMIRNHHVSVAMWKALLLLERMRRRRRHRRRRGLNYANAGDN